MAKKVQLKDIETNEEIYPITTKECVIGLGDVSSNESSLNVINVTYDAMADLTTGIDITEEFKKVVKTITYTTSYVSGEYPDYYLFDDKSIYVNIRILNQSPEYGSTGILYRVFTKPYGGVTLYEVSIPEDVMLLDDSQELAAYTLDITMDETPTTENYTVILKAKNINSGTNTVDWIAKNLPKATAKTDGLMSSADKVKLDSLGNTTDSDTREIFNVYLIVDRDSNSNYIAGFTEYNVDTQEKGDIVSIYNIDSSIYKICCYGYISAKGIKGDTSQDGDNVILTGEELQETYRLFSTIIPPDEESVYSLTANGKPFIIHYINGTYYVDSAIAESEMDFTSVYKHTKDYHIYVDNNIDITKDFAVLMDDGTVFIERNIDWSTNTAGGLANENISKVAFDYFSRFSSQLWYSEYRPKFTDILSLGDISKAENRIVLYGHYRCNSDTPCPDWLNTTDQPFKLIDHVLLNGHQRLPVNADLSQAIRLCGIIVPTNVTITPPANAMSNYFFNSRFEDGGEAFGSDEATPFYTIDVVNMDQYHMLFHDAYIENLATIKLVNNTKEHNTDTAIFAGTTINTWNPRFFGTWINNLGSAHGLGSIFVNRIYDNSNAHTDIVDFTKFNLSGIADAAGFAGDGNYDKIRLSIPSATSIQSAFNKLKYVEITALGPCSRCTISAFSGCADTLETLIINMTNVTNTSANVNTSFPSTTDARMFKGVFKNCTDVRLKGLKVDCDLSGFCNMSMTSAKYIIDNLGTITGKTLTLYQKLLDKLPDAWKTIATNKGWTLTGFTSTELDTAYSGASLQREEYDLLANNGGSGITVIELSSNEIATGTEEYNSIINTIKEKGVENVRIKSTIDGINFLFELDCIQEVEDDFIYLSLVPVTLNQERLEIFSCNVTSFGIHAGNTERELNILIRKTVSEGSTIAYSWLVDNASNVGLQSILFTYADGNGIITDFTITKYFGQNGKVVNENETVYAITNLAFKDEKCDTLRYLKFINEAGNTGNIKVVSVEIPIAKNVATTTSNGLMSAEDKTKLDSLTTNTATTLSKGYMSSDDKGFLETLRTERQIMRLTYNGINYKSGDRVKLSTTNNPSIDDIVDRLNGIVGGIIPVTEITLISTDIIEMKPIIIVPTSISYASRKFVLGGSFVGLDSVFYKVVATFEFNEDLDVMNSNLLITT